jgi:hypothetical protein
MHGKYPIKHDAITGNAYVARSNGVPLYDEREVNQAMGSESAAQALHPNQQPLSPAAFAGKIRESYRNQSPQKQQLAN